MTSPGSTWTNLWAGLRRRLRRGKAPHRKCERRLVLESLEVRKLLSVTANLQPMTLAAGQVGYIDVGLSRAPMMPASVQYRVSSGTAVLGTDLSVPPEGTIDFKPGQTRAESVAICTAVDPGLLPNRVFTVSLFNPTGGVSLGTSRVQDTIVEPVQGSPTQGLVGTSGGAANDSSRPQGMDDASSSMTVSISDAGILPEGQTASFQLTLSPTCGSEVSVYYQTQSETAIGDGINYYDASGFVTIPAGSATGWIYVNTVNQGGNEANGAYFDVDLQSASDDAGDSFSISGGGAASAVLQESTAATVNISDAGTITPGQTASFQLTLSTPCQSDVIVYYNTADVTAYNGEDYYGGTSFTTISQGSTSGWITVATNPNATDDNDNYFCVQLDGAGFGDGEYQRRGDTYARPDGQFPVDA